MIKKKIGYYGLEHWCEKDWGLHGDMGYAIEDEAETRFPIEDIEKHRRMLETYINSEEADDNCDCEKDNFAVYSIVKTDAYLDEDDDRLPMADIDLGKNVTTDVFVCQTREWARERIEPIYRVRGERPVFHYRNDFGMFN